MPRLTGSLWRHIAGLLALFAFAATSPGLSGLELAAHLGGWVDLSHERQAHLEPAGQSAHSDACQLGVVACHSRLPEVGPPPLRSVPIITGVIRHAVTAPPATRGHSLLLPRAPPV